LTDLTGAVHIYRVLRTRETIARQCLTPTTTPFNCTMQSQRG
jgi:hypothetical protein